MRVVTFAAIVVGAVGGFIAFFGAALLQYMSDSGHAPVSGGNRNDP